MAKRTKKMEKSEVQELKPDIVIPQPQKKHRGLKWLGGCCVAILILMSIIANFVLGAFALHTALGGFIGTSNYDETVIASRGERDDKIALLHLSGIISSPTDPQSLLNVGGSTQDVPNQLTVVEQDPAVKAVVIEVDSPGGSVTASEDLFQKISEVQKAGLPVVTYVHTESTSGAYYATCGTNYIIANPTSLNGSIGVIMESYNYGELLNKYGVHVETYKSGPYKDMLSGTRPTTAEEKEIVQGIIESSYNIFIDHIIAGRKLDKTALLKVADGRVLTAAQAKDAKLIDQVGVRGDAFAKAAELGKTANYDVIEYSQKGGFLSRLGIGKLGAATSFVTNLLEGHTQRTGLYFL